LAQKDGKSYHKESSAISHSSLIFHSTSQYPAITSHPWPLLFYTGILAEVTSLHKEFSVRLSLGLGQISPGKD